MYRPMEHGLKKISFDIDFRSTDGALDRYFKSHVRWNGKRLHVKTGKNAEGMLLPPDLIVRRIFQAYFQFPNLNDVFEGCRVTATKKRYGTMVRIKGRNKGLFGLSIKRIVFDLDGIPVEMLVDGTQKIPGLGEMKVKARRRMTHTKDAGFYFENVVDTEDVSQGRSGAGSTSQYTYMRRAVLSSPCVW